MTDARGPLPSDQDKAVRQIANGFYPRVLVRHGKRGLCHIRRPFKKRGHWAVRLQGTAWLLPLNENENVRSSVFEVTYAPAFLKPKAGKP